MHCLAKKCKTIEGRGTAQFVLVMFIRFTRIFFIVRVRVWGWKFWISHMRNERDSKVLSKVIEVKVGEMGEKSYSKMLVEGLPVGVDHLEYVGQRHKWFLGLCYLEVP